LRTTIKLPSRSKRGISNVIVVMLSLVLVVMVVVNVVLWSYQMNQFDWERMHEVIAISGVDRVNNSSWFTSQREFAIEGGTRTNGTYLDTQLIDGNYESFQGMNNSGISIIGDFVVNESVNVRGLEVQMRYKVNDTDAKWYLDIYNWNSSSYTDNNLNSTQGGVSSQNWTYLAVNFTNEWKEYVRDDGTIRVKVLDDGLSVNQTTVDIDFLGVRLMVNATNFNFQNDGPLTSHLVALWIDNSTLHKRYAISVFVSEGEVTSYFRSDISLPNDFCIIKVVTDRGNIAVFSIN